MVLLSLCLQSSDPFQAGPALLTQQPAVQIAGSARPNPAIFSLPGGGIPADPGTAGSSLGGAAVSSSARWLGDQPTASTNGTGDGVMGNSRSGVAKPASWFV